MSDSMWCDDFDADLLKVVPGIESVFEPVEGKVTLWTLCIETGGKINCPAMWNGIGALFWMGKSPPAYKRNQHGWLTLENGCTTHDPFVKCSPLEMARDLWSHQYQTTILESRRGLRVLFEFDASRLGREMWDLMYDARGADNLVCNPPAENQERVKEFWRGVVYQMHTAAGL